MKRIISLVLVLLTVLSLVACTGSGGNETDSSGSNSVSTDVNNNSSSVITNPEDYVPSDFVPPEAPKDEMNGKEYIILQHVEPESPFGYSQDSLMGQKVAARVAEVCEEYGCTLSFSYTPYDEGAVSQLIALQFAENSGDLIFFYSNAMLNRVLGTGGENAFCLDLLRFDHIINFWDFNKWGNLTARECMMAGGVFYGVTPALWEDCTPLPYYTVVYNKDILDVSGAVDPQESWEKGEWDHYAMLEVISKTTNEADGIWGMTAAPAHMLRATFLATGLSLINIEEISVDGAVKWSSNLDSPEVTAAFQWLKNTLTKYKKCFNNGQYEYVTDKWSNHQPFNEGLSAMCVTRPRNLFGDVVVDGPENFGITTWAGETPNTLTGFYESVYAVAIPSFAQNGDHSAYLMYSLFEGLEGIETYSDVLDYYSNTYFNSELDITLLVRNGANFQYTYWPNDCDRIWNELANDFSNTSSVSGLIGKHIHNDDEAIETYMIPNQVQLKAWKDSGKID